jgi:neopullulanase
MDASSFAGRIEQLMTIYDPAVIASQLNLIGSHDAPRALTVLGGDRTALRQAVLLQMTLPGTPCVYYGDEIGMEGGVDPDCRAAFPTDPEAGDRELRSFVRDLIVARREHLALRRGAVSVAAVGMRAVAIAREAEGFRAIVALNAGAETERLSIPRPTDERLAPIATPGLADVVVEPSPDSPAADGTRVLVLPPRSGAILLAG